MWNKILGYVVLAAGAFVGGLLVLLKLKDRKLQQLDLQNLKTRFSTEDVKAEEDLLKLRKDFDAAKTNLHSDSDK